MIRSVVLRALLVWAAAGAQMSLLRAQAPANLRGQVTDPSGAAVPAAAVIVTSADGDIRQTSTDATGTYAITGIAPGAYTVRISANGFSNYERSGIEFVSGRTTFVDVKLVLATAQQEITVSDSVQIGLDPDKNAGAIVLKGDDLDMLSDDPDDLQNDLLALAGPAAGPNGGQIFVDGFSNGQLPPKNSIREVRVNSNPFSAEFDKIGFGRVEILTKPGTDKLRGMAFIETDSARLDARNPYAQEKPSFLTSQFQGNLSGSLNKKASFFFDANRRKQDDQALVYATVLDSNFQPQTLQENVPQPVTRTTLSPRLDYQLSPNVTLQGRYTLLRTDTENYAVGGFSLPALASQVERREHTAQFTAAWVANASTINESRFQYAHRGVWQTGTSDSPTITVAGAFVGGASPVADGYDRIHSYEFQNYTSRTHGTHLTKFGVRIRGTVQTERNDQYFNGNFSYGALTTADCRDLPTCHAYQPTVLGLAQGLSMAQIIANGGGSSQYMVVTGNPLLTTGLVDAAPFVQDDWRVAPSVTLSLGLRYEVQNQISDWRALAPRVGLAWGIGSGQGRARQPKTVVRAGFGIFYDRFAVDNVMTAERLNGVNQLRFVVPTPQFACVQGACSGNVPPPSSLVSEVPITTYRIDPGLEAPQMIQSAIGIERQLPKSITVSVNYTNTRGVHQLRSRNINAPLPGTYTFGVPSSGIYPLGNASPLDQYESSGLFKQNQLTLNVNARLNARFSMFGFYNYGHAYSNTDGVGSFPVNTYDEAPDWGRAGFDVRHRVFVGGNVAMPLGIRLAPMINYTSAPPFNIVIGQDVNGDGQTNDRPAYATPASNPANLVNTAYGVLDLRPAPGETIIPRNLGVGFANFTINMRVSRTWGFGEPSSGGGNAAGVAPGGPAGRGFGGGVPGGRPGGGPAPGGGFFGGGAGNHKYNVTLSAEVRNLLNAVNPGTPVGVVTSPLFGLPQSLAGGFGGPGGFSPSQTANRRIQMQLRFTF